MMGPEVYEMFGIPDDAEETMYVATVPDKNSGAEMCIRDRKKIPAIVKEMSDDEAIIKMVDANIQREEILPSERAFSLKMKMDAIKRQGKRSDLTSDHNGPKLAAVEVGQTVGISSTQVKRYIRLTELIPELLECTDNKKIGLVMAVDLSYLDEQVQKWVYEYFKENEFLKPVQVCLLYTSISPTSIELGQSSIFVEKELQRVNREAMADLDGKDIMFKFPPTFASTHTALAVSYTHLCRFHLLHLRIAHRKHILCLRILLFIFMLSVFLRSVLFPCCFLRVHIN